MASTSNSPFELEDQTDEDFFDKLVDDDDDDDVVIGSGGVSGLTNTGLGKGNDGVLDGEDSDEVKAFANLSLGEDGSGNGGVEVKGVECGEVKAIANLSVREDGSGIGGVETNGVGSVGVTASGGSSGSGDSGGIGGVETNGVDSVGVIAFGSLSEDSRGVGGMKVNGVGSLEVKDQVKGGDGEVATGLVLSDSFCFGNGQVVEDGVGGCEDGLGLRRESSGSPGAGVKEVQWSAFGGGAGGFGSSDDFFNEFGQVVTENYQDDVSFVPANGGIENGAIDGSLSQVEQSGHGEDTNSIEYWEKQYPGWKLDPNTGQWYQLDYNGGTGAAQGNFHAAAGNMQGNFGTSGEGQWSVSEAYTPAVSYVQPNVQSPVEATSRFATTDNVSKWNSVPQQNGEYQYPAHMIFDAQYPDHYYDTMAQNWFLLADYHSSVQSTDQTQNMQGQNGFPTAVTYSNGNSQGISNNGFQHPSNEGVNVNGSWGTSLGNYNQQGSNSWGGFSGPAVDSNAGQPSQDLCDPNYSKSQVVMPNFTDTRGTVSSYGNANQSPDRSNWVGGINSFVPVDNSLQQFGASPNVEHNKPDPYSSNNYRGQDTAEVSQPSITNGYHVPYVPSGGRSSAGRPPHALATFGFGGKLVVMKDCSAGGFALHGSKDANSHFLSVLNLMEVVRADNGPSTSSYCSSLCHQSFPGPLGGGSSAIRELNKWIDERLANSELLGSNYGKGEAPKLLLSLLKIAWQHYGKLRSFGADTGLKENDLPESAVANLFACAKRNADQFSQYTAIAKCLMTLPSEAHIQTIASEVQNLLISGRKKEALQCAQEGQFWGLALILARELGDQFYADTVKQMAVSQLVVGSPLRTLCLLIAKKPEEVFSHNVIPTGNLPGAVPMLAQPVQSAGYSMLDNWEENLAVIAANRTENDHLVITHLGDCLWREKSDVIAAHICYLLAEADFELYSDSARLCLIGADHLNFPRTYVSPEAIQRTELFEYAKVLGNSQFVLLQLQPYKLIYAHMLAEVGRVSDSLKYCQAVSKSLKTVRSPEADTLKQLLLSLEDRIKMHQQSGYTANLAPAKIVGKLLNFFDSTAHRVVGGLPPPVPSITQGSALGNEQQFHPPGSKVSGSHSTMGMSSLNPSASMEPISQWAADGIKMATRSNSEPNIGRTPSPDQVDTSNEATTSSAEKKQPSSTGTSRFGRLNFGAQFMQKAVGLVLKPRQGRQAKLGDTNKFYYDEKLKRWVEEGAEPPAEESALPPPPTATAFYNEKSDYDLKNGLNDGFTATDGSPESTTSTPPGSSFGIPAIPPSSNQFSARGRMGARSRYVDTFNKGGGASANLFQAPSVPSVKPASLASAKFFVPTAAASPTEHTLGTETGIADEASESGEQKNSMSPNFAFTPAGTMQRPSTFDNIPNEGKMGSGEQKHSMSPNFAFTPAGTMQRSSTFDNIPNEGKMGSGFSSVTPQSRRTASWSVIHSDTCAPPSTAEVKASPLRFMPSNHSSRSLQNNGGNFGDDLQEVEL